MPVFYDETLNPEQKQAVYAQPAGGGVLVIAGAGTGKTRVLTARIIHLLHNGLATPRNIMAVTFTNKAAKEMRARVATALPAAGLTIGTFHGICHRILRVHAAAVGWDKNFHILDAQDQKSFLRRLYKENEIDPHIHPPQDVRHYINAAKEKGLRPPQAPQTHPMQQAFNRVYRLYDDATRREHKLDFAELLLSVLDLFTHHPDIRRRYAERFSHILIDELQDTNAIQFEWLKFLDSGSNCFFGVGDDDQSIYAFRGAQPMIMRRFQDDLRAATLVRLQRNYRSVGNILTVANHLIRHNHERIGKNLASQKEDGGKVQIYRHADAEGEADAVAQAVAAQHQRGSRLGECCVLYRTNAQSRQFEMQLVQRRIPYRVFGGSRFYERMEIKHALAYLRLLISDDRDSLLRIINMPPRKIGAKTMAPLLTAPDIFTALNSSTHPGIRAFNALRADLQTQAVQTINGKQTLAELMRVVIVQSGLRAHYESKGEDERIENLNELINAAAQFESSSENETAGNADAVADTDDEDEGADIIAAFLSLAALESPADGDGDGDTLSLMTVHAAKGLEFDHLHIVGLEEGLFPHSRALAATTDIEEERRLLYVAITRARQTVALHLAQQRITYGTSENNRPSRFNLPSRFLKELPKENITDHRAPSLPGSFIKHRHHATNTTNATANTAAPSLSALSSLPPGNSGRIGLTPGATVRHPRYGIGVVVKHSGSGKTAVVEVAFKTLGIKSFNPTLARLQKLD